MRDWILARYQVYARVCLYMGIFLLPIVFYRKTADVFNLVKITALLVFALAALAFWLAWSVERRVWLPRFRLAYAAAGFLGVCALATALSSNPALSLVGLYHRYGGLIPFVLYAAVMVLMVGLYWERPGDLKEVARASAAACLICGAYVLIQAAGLDWIDWREPGGGMPEYPVGTMGNSNFAGAALGIGAPFLMYIALTAKREIWRRVLMVAVGLELLAVWFTQTRGGMVAAFAGLTVMAFMYRDRLPRWIRTSVAVAVAGGIVTAVMVIWHPGFDEAPGILARAKTLRTETFTVRTYYWGAAWNIFLDHPVLGTGLETYYANYPPYRAPQDGAIYGLTITDKPHNIFLEYAANAGVLGIGSYLLLVGAGLWQGYRRSRRLDGQPRLLLTTFTSVLAGYLAQGVFSIDVPPLAAMGWVALGGIATIGDPSVVAAKDRISASLNQARSRSKGGSRAGSRRRERELDRSPVLRSRPAQWPVHAGTAVATIALVVMGARPLLADAKAKTGQTKQEVLKAPSQEVEADLESAIKLHPLEPSYRVQVGAISEGRAGPANDVETNKRLLSEALRRYDEALRLQPGNIFYIMNVARVRTTWAQMIDPGTFAEADEWWSRAVVHDPTDWVVHNEHALMLNHWSNATAGDLGLRRRGLNELEIVVRIRPDFVPAWLNLGKVYRVLGEIQNARAAIDRALKLEPENEEARSLRAALS